MRGFRWLLPSFPMDPPYSYKNVTGIIIFIKGGARESEMNVWRASGISPLLEPRLLLLGTPPLVPKCVSIDGSSWHNTIKERAKWGELSLPDVFVFTRREPTLTLSFFPPWCDQTVGFSRQVDWISFRTVWSTREVVFKLNIFKLTFFLYLRRIFSKEKHYILFETATLVFILWFLKRFNCEKV